MANSAERNNGNHKLGSVLWNCANTLRGSAVDRTDWKAYILPLLFLKRISDVWDEETEEARALFGEADPVDFPEVHRFVLTCAAGSKQRDQDKPAPRMYDCCSCHWHAPSPNLPAKFCET